MKFYLYLILFTPLLIKAQKMTLTTVVDDVKREFIISRPSGPAPSGGFPLVFMFHGTSGDGEKFFNISGWKELGEKEKFVTVFPSSLEYCVEEGRFPHKTTKWNNGNLQEAACPNQVIKDDIKFIKKMVDTLTSFMRINNKMIFAAGFSNGGSMTAKMAIEMGDIFSALAISSSFLHDLDSGLAKIKVPVWQMIGTVDSMFLERLMIPNIPFNDSCLIFLRNGIENMVNSYKLKNTYSKDSNELTINYNYTNVLPGVAPAHFRFSIVKGLSHQYPNGFNFPPMNAAALQWEFFKSVVNPSSAKDASLSSIITVWPNPASDYLYINSAQNINIVELNNIYGIKYLLSAENNILNLSSLPPQIY
ncbi:MAG: hypothetical protein HOP11_02690, partial [Saprospiraceae bacterium]|nr:hypothetical protein [Saprospiraceae bacterium]